MLIQQIETDAKMVCGYAIPNLTVSRYSFHGL